MKRITIITAILLVTRFMYGQMSLNDCLEYAAEHAHDNIFSRLELSKATVDKRITAAELMPDLSFSSSGNLSFGRNIDPETNTYDNKQTLSTGFGLNLSVPLFDGMVRLNNLKAAETARRRRMTDAEIERDRISFDVIRSFFNVAYCTAMVDQMKMQLQRDSLDLEATRRWESVGVKSGADVAQLEALVATDEFELTNQRGLLAKAYHTLKGAMGMPPDGEPLRLTFDVPEFLPEAGAMNPRVTEAQLALRQSELELRAARGLFSPRISLSGGISTSYYRMFGSNSTAAAGFSRQWHDNMGQYVGVSVAIPLFTGLATTNRLKRAKINVEQSRVKLEKARYDVERETADARLDLLTASAELEAARKRLDAEMAAYDAVHRRYELGNASVIDLYTAGAQLTAAKAACEGKRIQVIISKITLSYYYGAKLI
ncbi:MAG: TolC family protein [Muribaculaceae bacterium]|nr:TolC family protein [Muribaculaceae bacterium]